MTEYIRVQDAAERLNISGNILKYHIEKGNIKSDRGRISSVDFNRIEKQHSKYIGLEEFIRSHNQGRFDSTQSRNRNKYIDFLEKNDYFGVQLNDSEGMLFLNPEKDWYYITREDAELLDVKSNQFFFEFGFSFDELIEKELINCEIEKSQLKEIRSFVDGEIEKKGAATGSLLLFVREIKKIKDIYSITPEELSIHVKNSSSSTTRKYFKAFMNRMQKKGRTQFGRISQNDNKESKAQKAYSYSTLVNLWECIFNEEYILENDMIKKALDNHFYAEMWLFLSILFMCGWRKNNIPSAWCYIMLEEENQWGINTSSLYDDILHNRVSEKTYEDIAIDVIKRIDLSQFEPDKTGEKSLGYLIVAIGKENLIHFGKLVLIAEYHHLSTKEGYMKTSRTTAYLNWVNCKKFFGERFYAITGKNNIRATSLNKSVLQGNEKAAELNGVPPLNRLRLTSLMRNHSNLSTTILYIQDHGLTGENASFVLSLMFDAGVNQMYMYQVLFHAYPELMNKLSPEERAKLIGMIPIDAYELDITAAGSLAAQRLYDRLLDNDISESVNILKGMYEVCNGNGRSKYSGVGCLRRGLGFNCEDSLRDCIIDSCPFHVLISEGLPALVSALMFLYRKYTVSEGRIKRKYKAKIENMILLYNGIFAKMNEYMDPKDYQGIKMLIEGAINEFK